MCVHGVNVVWGMVCVCACVRVCVCVVRACAWCGVRGVCVVCVWCGVSDVSVVCECVCGVL